MEAHAEAPSGSEGEEGMMNHERPIDEVGKETSGFLPGADQELIGSEQEMSEELAELIQETVNIMEKEEMALGVSEEEAVEMAELESGEEKAKAKELSELDQEFECSGGKEKTEELSELDQNKMSVLISPAEGGSGGEMEQRDAKELVHVEALAGEGGIILEMGRKGSGELVEAEEGDHVNSEKGGKNEDVTLIVMNEKEVELSGGGDLVEEETKEVSGSDHRDAERERREDVAESAENQEEVRKLSGLEQGEILEQTEEEKEMEPAVGQGKAGEPPGTDEGELPEAVGGDAASAEIQREQEELVGLGQEEIQVLTKEGVRASTIDERENQVLVEASEKGPEVVIERKDMASRVDQAKKVSGTDQRETESKTAEEDVTAAVSQKEIEGLMSANQGEVEQVTGKEDVVPAACHGEVDRVLEDLREAEGGTGRTISQGEIEDLIGASEGEVDQVTRKEDVIPAVSQMEGDTVPEDLRKEERVVEGDEEARVSQGEAAAELRKKDVTSALGQVEEDVTSVLGQVEAVKVPGADEKNAENVDLAMDQGKAGEDVAQVVEREVSTEGNVLAVIEGDSTETGDAATGKVDMALVVAPAETQEVTIEQEMTLPIGMEQAVEIVELPKQEDVPICDLEGIPLQSDEEMKSSMTQEKIEESAGSEKRDTKDLEGLDQGEAKQLGSVGMVAEEEPGKTSSKDQGEAEELVTYQDQIAEVAGVAEKVFSKYQMDAVERKVTSQGILAWRPELGDNLAGPTQEIAQVGSEEEISRRDPKRAKPSQEEAAVFARAGWRTPDLSGQTLRVAEEWGRPGSSTASLRILQHRAVGSQEQQRRGKGKRILGLAGLRQGPILAARKGATGGRGGVLDHLAPGLIVTSLTAQAEQRGLVKEDHRQLGRRALEQRETRSAEPGLHGTRVKVGEEMVLMGYRIGREGMSCFSEADNRTVMFQQRNGLEETAKESSQELAEPVKQEQGVKEQEVLGNNVTDVAGQHLEGIHLAWLGRPLSGGYAASRPPSGWTAGVGAGHGLALGPLHVGIKEQIDMMVIGQGAAKSARQSPEPPRLGVGGRMPGFASKPEDVHWLRKE